MRLYEVCARCGHIGKGKFVKKIFAIKAETAKDAAKKVKWLPRVQHHKKDVIQYVCEIDRARFDEIILNNENDKYFHCYCIQDQRTYEEAEIFYEEVECCKKDSENIKKVFCGKLKLRNPKKYMNNFFGMRCSYDI